MVINTQKLKTIATKIMSAVDTQTADKITDLLEIQTNNGRLTLSVTNNEYFVQVSMDTFDNAEFDATVEADLFLKLVSNTTSETIDLTMTDQFLAVRGNGSYKLPLIFDGSKLMKLSPIVINNVLKDFTVSAETLNSIYKYNSRELNKGIVSNMVQMYYYVDEEGAITFVDGACVNEFKLAQPVKMLLSNKLVKLFRLFDDGDVHFQFGVDMVDSSTERTKVLFSNNDVCITSLLLNDVSMINCVPTNAIRTRANNIYPANIVCKKDELLDALKRLLIFSSRSETAHPYGTFHFDTDSMTISDISGDNNETIKYITPITQTNLNDIILELNDFKSTIESVSTSTINMSFGDGAAVVITHNNIRMIVPEVKFN